MAKITAYSLKKGDFKVTILATTPQAAIKIAERALARSRKTRR